MATQIYILPTTVLIIIIGFFLMTTVTTPVWLQWRRTLPVTGIARTPNFRIATTRSIAVSAKVRE